MNGTRKCLVDDCDKKFAARDMCHTHYGAWRRTHPDGALPPIEKPTDEERFWALADKAGECWIWEGSTGAGGYGTFWLDGKHNKAHRMAYRYAGGDLPDDLTIDHLCRVIRCVNPEHLEAVTNEDNASRAWKHRERGDYCRRGHIYEGNSFIDRNGYINCVLCRRISESERRRRKRTHCKDGHELTEENTRVTKAGHRFCRACMKGSKKDV